MLIDLPYPLRLCVEMMHYAALTSDMTREMRPSDVRQALSKFFDDAMIEEASNILTGRASTISGNSSKKWEIWMEGYMVSGMEGVPGEAQKIGEVEAATFQEACDRINSLRGWQGRYDRDRLTVWGCSLYDNEAAARRSFG